ncbi:hypothetical protein AGMMS49983_15480 [Clostridia bacterium]|nr:hypothetical protein AGMMS49983_15480 [Clostridia bacterium]
MNNTLFWVSKKPISDAGILKGAHTVLDVLDGTLSEDDYFQIELEDDFVLDERMDIWKDVYAAIKDDGIDIWGRSDDGFCIIATAPCAEDMPIDDGGLLRALYLRHDELKQQAGRLSPMARALGIISISNHHKATGYIFHLKRDVRNIANGGIPGVGFLKMHDELTMIERLLDEADKSVKILTESGEFDEEYFDLEEWFCDFDKEVFGYR